jgi:hypothetical protein
VTKSAKEITERSHAIDLLKKRNQRVKNDLDRFGWENGNVMVIDEISGEESEEEREEEFGYCCVQCKV